MSSKHLNELVPKKALLASAVAVALLSTNAFAAPPTATYLINGNDSDGALDLSSQNLEVQPNDVYQIYGWYHSETINRYRSEEADVTLTGLLISSENSRFAGAVNEDRMVDTVPDNLQLRKNRLKIINSSAQVIQGAWGTSTKAHGIELTENRLLIQNTEDIREFSKTSALYAAFGNLRTQNYDGSLSASRNVLTIESTAPTAYTFVYGVSLYATNQNTVEATDNVLEFKNVTSAEVWRAVAADVNAANGRETASGNKLLLTKSTVIPLEYLAASVVYDDGTESSVVNTGNTVVLEDSTVLGRVYGGFDGGQKTGMDEGNTIEARGINKVKSIGGFDTLKLVVDATRNAQSPVLDVEESVDFTGRTIKVEGTDSFDENASYTLLSADEITGLTQERLVFEGLWEDAEGKLVLTEDTLGVNIVDVTASNSSKTLSESLLGTVAFVNQGAEFMADEGLAALVRNARLESGAPSERSRAARPNTKPDLTSTSTASRLRRVFRPRRATSFSRASLKPVGRRANRTSTERAQTATTTTTASVRQPSGAATAACTQKAFFVSAAPRPNLTAFTTLAGRTTTLTPSTARFR